MNIHTEQIEPWRTLKTSLQVPTIRAVYLDSLGLSLDLIDEESNSNEILSFENFLSYKVTHESYLVKVWGSLSEDKMNYIFYQIKESEYIQQFNDLSLGIYSDLAITHYAVYTDDICVDVLSTFPPQIARKELTETEK